MTIFGVALLAICSLIGALVGEALGAALGVKANVGGVGIAMVLLLVMRWQLIKRGLLDRQVSLGVEFWGALYIPVVVAMAAIQNVVAAIKGGPMVVTAGTLGVVLCLIAVTLLARVGGPTETMDEIEARLAAEAEPARGQR
jgi:malonate transporter MadL subunit